MPPGTLFRRLSLATLLLLGLLTFAAGPAGAALPRTAATFRVCLQPLGKHEAGLLEPIARGIRQAYGFEVRRLAPQPLPAKAWYPPRSRYRARGLLDHLRAGVVAAEPRCDAVLGFTAADVSISKGEHPDWGVMGLAYQGQHVAVVSSFRLRRDADARRFAQRAVKVSIHELGHVLGLPHRADAPACIMNDARGSVRVIDGARGGLCAGERAAAEAALGFALPRREQLDWVAILQ